MQVEAYRIAISSLQAYRIAALSGEILLKRIVLQENLLGNRRIYSDMRYINVASVHSFQLFKTHIYPLSAEKKR